MNAKFTIILGIIVCGIFLILLLNVLGSSSNFRQPKPQFAADSKNANNLLDLRYFKYAISPKCKASKLIWIVTSYAGDDSKRSALRRAYNSQELEDLGIERVFLLGKIDLSQEKSGITQAVIENEAHRFKDIVQGNFIEAYRNLTYKHVMGLKWSVENCHHFSYVMKMDDDIIINLYEILDKLKNTNINNSLAGIVFHHTMPVRDPNSTLRKWYVTKNEFALDYYPEYVSGWLYITTFTAVAKLVNQAKSHSKYFWIDDVFVTGILREESSIGLVDIREMYTTDFQFLKCCIEDGRNGLKCEFAVGPNYGDADFQIQFKQFAQFCQSKCSPRPIGKTCDVAKKKNI